MKVTLVAWAERDGGAEQYLVSLYSALSHKGVRTTLVGALPDQTAFEKVHPIQLPGKWSRRNMFRSAARAVRDRRQFLATIADLPTPDVFHLQYKREQILLTRALASRAPVVWTEHGPLPSGRLTAMLRWAYRRASRHVAAIIAVSSATEESVRSVTRSTQVVRIDNAVDPSQYAPATFAEKRRLRSELGLPEGQVLLWAGQLHEGKLPALALDTMREWSGTSVMLGDGPLAPVLEQERLQIPDRDIRLVGRVPSTAPWLAAADVLLFTSAGRGEGLPLTLLEARATGVPIVANEGCGAEEFVRDSGGQLVPADPRLLAAGAWSAATATASARTDDRSQAAWTEWADHHLEVLRATRS